VGGVFVNEYNLHIIKIHHVKGLLPPPFENPSYTSATISNTVLRWVYAHSYSVVHGFYLPCADTAVPTPVNVTVVAATRKTMIINLPVSLLGVIKPHQILCTSGSWLLKLHSPSILGVELEVVKVNWG